MQVEIHLSLILIHIYVVVELYYSCDYTSRRLPSSLRAYISVTCKLAVRISNAVPHRSLDLFNSTHSLTILFLSQGSQFYANCAHVRIVNSNANLGTPSPLTKIPGVYAFGQRGKYYAYTKTLRSQLLTNVQRFTSSPMLEMRLMISRILRSQNQWYGEHNQCR